MRLKPINWTRIPNNKAKTTVWSDIDDAEIHDKLAGSFYKVIDKAFQVVEVKPSPSAGAIKGEWMPFYMMTKHTH